MYKRVWVIIAGIVGVGIILVLFFANIPIIASAPAVTTAQPTVTASTSTGTPSSTETVLHLDIYVHGAAEPLPIVATSTQSGESIQTTLDGLVIFTPSIEGETLGQIFNALDERLTPLCIAQYCASQSDSFRIYVNGELWQGDPSTIPLQSHDEIAIVYGTASEIPNPVASSYSFPAGD
jgi:hypothetical protein